LKRVFCPDRSVSLGGSNEHFTSNDSLWFSAYAKCVWQWLAAMQFGKKCTASRKPQSNHHNTRLMVWAKAQEI